MQVKRRKEVKVLVCRENLHYLPPEPSDWAWTCPVGVAGANPADLDECGADTEPNQTLCRRHEEVLPDDDQEVYTRHYADQLT